MLRGSSREASVLRLGSRNETVLEEVVFIRGRVLGLGLDNILELWFILDYKACLHPKI